MSTSDARRVSGNDAFEQLSFLQGANADWVEMHYARYASDPSSVDEAWRAFFDGLDDAEADPQTSAAGPSWTRSDWPQRANGELVAALDGQWDAVPDAKALAGKIKGKAAKEGKAPSAAEVRTATVDSIRAIMFIRAHRHRGHLAADLDPLDIVNIENPAELRAETYGFTEADMDRPIFIDQVLGRLRSA
jgi:2-oxoglutarate dehydrogenase E1 component